MGKAPEPSSEGGAPEWMVSYADMITIMMAFFVVLYASTGTTSSGKDKGEKAGKGVAADQAPTGGEAGAGPKEGRGGKEGIGTKEVGSVSSDVPGSDQKAQMDRVFQSLYQRFGPDWTLSNYFLSGSSHLRKGGRKEGSKEGKRNANIVSSGGKHTGGQIGDDARKVRTIKPGDTVLAGGRIYFDEFKSELSEPQKKRLKNVAEDLAGKLQKIEIRGHTSRQEAMRKPGEQPGAKPPSAAATLRNAWDLAFARCLAVMDLLVADGIDPKRIRLGVAGDGEPLDGMGEPVPAKQNARVEIHMLSEYVRTSSGARDETPKVPEIGARK